MLMRTLAEVSQDQFCKKTCLRLSILDVEAIFIKRQIRVKFRERLTHARAYLTLNDLLILLASVSHMFLLLRLFLLSFIRYNRVNSVSLSGIPSTDPTNINDVKSFKIPYNFSHPQMLINNIVILRRRRS